MARAIFYTHQVSGAYAGGCTCNHTHQMDKTAPYTHTYICVSGGKKC